MPDLDESLAKPDINVMKKFDEIDELVREGMTIEEMMRAVDLFKALDESLAAKEKSKELSSVIEERLEATREEMEPVQARVKEARASN